MGEFGDPSPGKTGIDPRRLTLLRNRVDDWVASGEIPAVSIALGRKDVEVTGFASGRTADDPGSEPVNPATTFLVASLTKPLTALAMMMQVEQGRATLDDPVVEHLPEFATPDKPLIRIRHLLTHTSGLPDMLTTNAELRTRHASFEEFLAGVYKTPLLFPVGTQVRYQSMGFVLLAAIVQRLAGKSLPDFLRAEVFEPLSMRQTRLGAPIASLKNHAWCRITEEAASTDWHWNSAYWLGFGAPWGGLITTANDYGRFLKMILRGGELDGVRVVSPATVAAMSRNQLPSIPELGDDWRKRYPWGLGWRLNWPGRSQFFGDLLGPRMFGHWGSTGTLAWVDPDRDALAVILTTLPQDPDGRYLALASNLLVSAFV